MNRIIKFSNKLILKRNMVTNFKNLVEMQEKSCAKHYNRPLFGTNISNIKWTTYQEWDEKIKIFRSFLHNIDVNKEDKVAIISNNKIEWTVAAYSTYSLGAIFVPMYQTQRKIDWKYILEDSKSKVLLITDKKIFKECKNFLNDIKHLKKIVYLNDNYHDLYTNIKFGDGDKYKNFFSDKDSVYPDENDLATIIYTSGTTGNPKGVEISHKNLVSNIKGIQDSFQDFNKICNENDRSISFLPWAHCYGQTCELHGLISSGASMYLSEGVDKLPEEIKKVKPTLLFSVPTLFNRIYDTVNNSISNNFAKKKLFDDALKTSKKIKYDKNNKFDLLKDKLYQKLVFSKIKERLGGNLKHSFVGGAATPLKVIEFFENINIPIIEGYGLTETSPIITLGTLDYPNRKLGSVGMPLPNNKVIIYSDNKILNSNQEGEILTAGPNIMKGYHNIDNDESTFLKLNNETYFRTGDLGYLDEMNRLFVTGRLKEQYKLENGKFVIPTIIENNLTLSPYIKQIIVYGENKPYNIALIVPEKDKLNEENLLTIDLDQFYIDEIKSISKNKNIKNYEVPKKVILLDEEFTLQNNLLTPKMSIKRPKVIEKYQNVIDNLYK